jgi:predicted nuclease of predicted toxin-antitoxin system
MTLTFLADENISPESADHLVTVGFRCHSLRRDGPRRLADRDIVALARREGHVIVTHDLDFGKIYFFTEGAGVGIVVLRLRQQTVENVNDVLERFLLSGALDPSQLQRSLVVLSETAYRVYRGPRGEF